MPESERPGGQWLADRFEEHRGRLHAVAYRMLGSLADADDAVQEAWLRMSRAGAQDVDSLSAWLTTITARVCLNMLRSRGSRREDTFGVHVPDPVIGPGDPAAGPAPEDEAVLADSVGLALLVVLDMLAPAERLAFVLHDMFDLPFEEIAPVVGRTPAAARQLASRARRRVHGAGLPEAGPGAAREGRARQRAVVDAFFAAARDGDFAALVETLDPEVTLRIDAGAGRRGSQVLRGADAVARQSLAGLSSGLAGLELHPVLVGGAPGVVATRRGRPLVVIGFTVSGGAITEIDAIAGPARVRRIAAGAIGEA